MTVVPFPSRTLGERGTVHVMGDRVRGFEIGHESASGSSWGYFQGPFATGQAAITAAYTLNRDTLGGSCDVYVCDAALSDAPPNLPKLSREDF